ncbi:hypothetical protein BGZ63DRAFT_388375 [Mariannaea sp. PMI_226]|nr:hypothetical protein BGZ63DRAFT_388375 [Mariannaea sp. PMI_226]
MHLKFYLLALPHLVATTLGHPLDDMSYELSPRVAELNKLIVSRDISLDSVNETSLSVRADCDSNPGLSRSLWVAVPPACIACMTGCVATATGQAWVQGTSRVASLDLWRQIGICGVTCVFSSSCTSQQAGTWQAQQPADFSMHSK